MRLLVLAACFVFFSFGAFAAERLASPRDARGVGNSAKPELAAAAAVLCLCSFVTWPHDAGFLIQTYSSSAPFATICYIFLSSVGRRPISAEL